MSPLALVADAHPASLELARYLLELGGFEVLCAKDGREAMSLAVARHPDVVVLELDLAVIDGCEVRDRLAADPTLAGIPVVAMTVYEISDYCPRHTRADFTAYVRKPLEPATFADQVHAALPTRD